MQLQQYQDLLAEVERFPLRMTRVAQEMSEVEASGQRELEARLLERKRSVRKLRRAVSDAVKTAREDLMAHAVDLSAAMGIRESRHTRRAPPTSVVHLQQLTNQATAIKAQIDDGVMRLAAARRVERRARERAELARLRQLRLQRLFGLALVIVLAVVAALVYANWKG